MRIHGTVGELSLRVIHGQDPVRGEGVAEVKGAWYRIRHLASNDSGALGVADTRVLKAWNLIDARPRKSPGRLAPRQGIEM